MSIQIRKATQKDIESLQSLWLEIMAYHQGMGPMFSYDANESESLKQSLIKRIESEAEHCFVAIQNELIVGCCFSRINDLPSFMGIKRTGYIAETVVSDACRGKGIGQSLVEKTLGYFKEKGCNAVELQVAVQNPKGIKFWEKLGFSPSTYHMHKVF